MKLPLTVPSLKTVVPEYKEKLQPNLFVELEALLDKGDITASVELVLPFTKSRFASGSLHEVLGLLYMEEQNFTKSCEAFEKAYSFSSKNITVLIYLGISYAKQGKLSDAVFCFEKVLKIQNYENLDMINFLAEFYNDAFSWNSTLELIKLVAGQLDTRTYLAQFTALRNLGREKDITDKIKSLEKDDISQEMFIILTESYIKQNKKIAASAALKEGLKRYPENSQLLWMLLDQEPDVSDKISVESVSKKFLGSMDKVKLDLKKDGIFYSLCLHKIYEEKKDFEKSFSFLTTGHSIRLENSVHNIESDKFVLRKMIDLNHVEIDLSNDLNDMAVVFLIGLPNSGTFEVGNLLKSVTKSCSGEDIPFLTAAINKSNFLNSGSTDDLIDIKHFYFKFVRDAGFSGKFFIDNNPLNFRFLPIIRKVFPNCIIIHTKRNLRHNLISCFLTNFKNDAYDFTFDQTILNEYAKIYKEAYNFFKLNELTFEHCFDFDEYYKNPKREASKFIDFFTTAGALNEFGSISDDFLREFVAIENQVKQETHEMVVKSEAYHKYISRLFAGL